MKEPKDWNDITLGQYREVLAADKRNLSHYGKAILIVAQVCTMSPALVKQMKKPDFMELLKRLQWVWKTQPKGEPIDRFEIKGQLFIVPSDIGRASIGEYADCDNAVHVHQEDKVMALAYTLAIYCRKPGEAVIDDAKELEARAQLMLSLPSTVADGLSGFFLTSGQLSLINSRLFTIRRVELLTQTGTWLNSVRRGGGARRFMHLPKITFLAWMRLQIAHVGRF